MQCLLLLLSLVVVSVATAPRGMAVCFALSTTHGVQVRKVGAYQVTILVTKEQELTPIGDQSILLFLHIFFPTILCLMTYYAQDFAQCFNVLLKVII